MIGSFPFSPALYLSDDVFMMKQKNQFCFCNFIEETPKYQKNPEHVFIRSVLHPFPASQCQLHSANLTLLSSSR